MGKALYVIKDAIAKKQDIVIGGRFSSKITNKDVVKELELLIRRKFFSHYAEGIAPCIYEDQDEDEGLIKNDSQDGEASTDNTEEDISLEELNEEIEFLKDECDELSQELNKTPRKNERLQIAMLAFEVCGNPNTNEACRVIVECLKEFCMIDENLISRWEKSDRKDAPVAYIKSLRKQALLHYWEKQEEGNQQE